MQSCNVGDEEVQKPMLSSQRLWATMLTVA
jgi:hypothetical protein